MPRTFNPSRRRETSEESPGVGLCARLPLKAKIAYVKAFVCVLCALGIIIGNGIVRSGYMASQGVAAYAFAFFLIQIGILAAATFVALHHAHPYARRWRDLVKRLAPASVLATTTVTLFKDLVGKHNGLVDRRDATLAQAGHTVEASRADVPRQQLMARHWELMASPEAVEDRLYPKPVKDPTKLNDRQAVEALTGISTVPTFSRKSTGAVHERQTQVRDALNKLRDQRRTLKRPMLHTTVVPGTPTTVTVGAATVSTEVPNPAEAAQNGKAKINGVAK